MNSIPVGERSHCIKGAAANAEEAPAHFPERKPSYTCSAVRTRLLILPRKLRAHKRQLKAELLFELSIRHPTEIGEPVAGMSTFQKPTSGQRRRSPRENVKT